VHGDYRRGDSLFSDASARRRLIGLAFVVLVGGGGAALLLGGWTGRDETLPPPGVPGPAVCPERITVRPEVPRSTRNGVFVAPDAREALLCEYPFDAAAPASPTLRVARRLDGDPAELIDYLNRLPGEFPEPQPCLGGGTEYAMVLGYADRAPAVVSLSCEWEHAGAVRRDGDLRKVLAHWQISMSEH
jgi:hypothetical protein